ncbi:hypothetical protein [Paenirhodobacter populi]|uniref:Rho-GAP domain-containing protein n=1 Tax=Paenirhodobacter populi TaxID=2306993 RepID=A0A443J7R0_9RHOB|nr:hypothetical protein [Sinirhodobacter populi]RWR16495.1 hypothetical protein D2T30_21485 [Sinirhodobacter populi]
MTLVPEPLTPPPAWRLLLDGLQSTEGKIDSLLSLLELLNDPEPDSQLGNALLEALHLIVEEARLIRAQREQQQDLIAQLRILISAQDVAAQETNRKIAEMHALLMGPVR